MAPDVLRQYEARKQPRAAFPVRPGFEVRVHMRLKEGEKERTQTFEGIVTAVTGAGIGKTFTVRRVAGDIGIERILPMFSPLITGVDVLRATKVRRARLTYLRKVGVRKRRKEDATLMWKVKADRETAQRAKEEAERKARQEREEAEKTAKEVATQEVAKTDTKVSEAEPKDTLPPTQR